MDKEKKSEDNVDFETVKRRAEARLRGKSEEEIELADIGVMIINDDEEVD